MRHPKLKQWFVTPFLTLLFIYSLAPYCFASTPPGAERHIFDHPTINGRFGYAAAADISGALDKVLIVVSGFDTDNNNRPEDELDDLGDHLQSRLNSLTADGWDVM